MATSSNFHSFIIPPPYSLAVGGNKILQLIGLLNELAVHPSGRVGVGILPVVLKFLDSVMSENDEPIIGWQAEGMTSGHNVLATSCALRSRVLDGLDERLKKYVFTAEITDAQNGFSYKAYRDRIDVELGDIEKFGMANHFLILGDLVKWVRAHGVPFGHACLSSLGSAVAWALGITDSDPLRWDFPLGLTSQMFTVDLHILRAQFSMAAILSVIEKTQGIHLDLSTIQLDDLGTYTLISREGLSSIAPLMVNSLNEATTGIVVRQLEDLIPLMALCRPIPEGVMHLYLGNRHYGESLEYIHPCLEPILAETFGAVFYYEQTLQIAQMVAGFTFDQATVLLKTLSIKNSPDIDSLRSQFIDAAEARGLAHDQVVKVFDLLAESARYTFSKASAVDKALTIYRMAWIKANHPSEFQSVIAEV